MVTTLRPLPRRGALALVLALALSFVIAFSALAEDIYPYGSANSHMYTHVADWINSAGAYEWRADAYTFDNYTDDSARITLQGWNNGIRWHATGNYVCYLNGGGDCYIPPIAYDAGPAGRLSGSGSTARYATTEHFLFWAGGSETLYTSADGGHSSYACFARSGNCP